jgi:hypothetical protein
LRYAIAPKEISSQQQMCQRKRQKFSALHDCRNQLLCENVNLNDKLVRLLAALFAVELIQPVAHAKGLERKK